ncbi:MAG: hypothetical protein IJJ73_08060 [Bacteroidaceae bacterium]|nr:hypothetical protein [Bacteroidaceae bacterium]
MGSIFGKSEQEKRRERYEDLFNASEKARVKAEEDLMESRREQELEKEKHEELTAELKELKNEFNTIGNIEKPQDKLETIMAIYSQTEILMNHSEDDSLDSLIEEFQEKIGNTIVRISIPQNRDEQLECLQLLTRRKCDISELIRWKKELARQVRRQYPKDPDFIIYCDKILGKEIPADASFGTKLKIILGNLLRK